MRGEQTISGAYERIEGHEELCALRYAGIQSAISELKGWIKWGVGGLFSMSAILMGFMAHQLYDNAQTRIDRIEAVGTVHHP